MTQTAIRFKACLYALGKREGKAIPGHFGSIRMSHLIREVEEEGSVNSIVKITWGGQVRQNGLDLTADENKQQKSIS